MNLYTEIKEMFRAPTPLKVAVDQLIVAELELLKAHTNAEYAQAMLLYNQSQIKRLKQYITATTKG